MNGWHRAAALLEEYAGHSDARAEAMHMDGARIVAAKIWMQSAPDREAVKWHNNRRLARLMRFFAEACRKHGDREDAIDDAPTPAEPLRVSFVDKDPA